MSWDHRQYGTKADPIRQSDLNDIASASGCSKRFQFRKEAEAEGTTLDRDFAGWRRCIGSAVHDTLRTYLTGNAAKRVLAGDVPGPHAVHQVLLQQMDRAAEGLPIEWFDQSPEAALDEAITMIIGALRDLPTRAESIVLCEAPFLTRIDAGDKEYWLSGTVDLVYRPKGNPQGLGLADWKTGQQRLPQLILDHGYQLGIYAHALAEGLFFPGLEGEQEIAQFPSELYVAHLRDYIPYKRASTKTVDRPEECAFYGVEPGDRVKVKAGDIRGPAWYAARRTESDVARLRHSIRKLVSGVRLGVLFENIAEHCSRCPFKTRCLSDGHAVSGDERAQVESALRGIELDGLEDVA